jgi:hypothetical protein
MITFCLLTMSRGHEDVHDAEFAFGLHSTADLDDEAKRFRLSAQDIALINPITRTCPIIASRRDADLLKRVHRLLPAVGAQRGAGEWNLEMFQKMIDVTIHADLCSFTVAPPALGWCPVYEGRSVRILNHRATTYEGASEADRKAGNPRESTETDLLNPYYSFHPSFWVAQETFKARLGQRGNNQRWFPSIRYVARNTDERTIIVAVRPYVPSNNKLASLFSSGTASEQACFVANFAALAFDYIARQKIGGTTVGAYIVEQLPVLPIRHLERGVSWDSAISLADWLLPRVVELTYTAWDLQPFAEDCGYTGPPFRWVDARRFLLRCELDAAFFHLYGIERDDVDYIMETFPIVKRKDEAVHGEYRTKRVILEIYDAMAGAARTGEPYRTRLDPPPADPRVAHQEQTAPEWLDRGARRLLEVPEIPARMPASHPYEVHTVVWALLHAAGGALPRLELARAFVLRSRPIMLVRHAPPELAPRAREWAEHIAARTVAGGALANAVQDLAARQGIGLTTDAEGRSVITTTEHTTPESQIDEWYRFEARLALAVLAASPPDQQQAIEASFSAQDRTFALAGAA